MSQSKEIADSETSMEDILDSIRKIIDEDEPDEMDDAVNAAANAVKPKSNAANFMDVDDEEKEMLLDDSQSETPDDNEDLMNLRNDAPLLSPENEMLSASAMSQLHRQFELGESVHTLEDLTKTLLRPMLKSWLDQNLPSLVERLVQQEITRITGRGIDSNLHNPD